MATLTIRKLDDTVYERLRKQAQRNNRSLEAEARQVLEQRTRSIDDIVADLTIFHDEMTAKHGLLPDSTPLIRALRDEE